MFQAAHDQIHRLRGDRSRCCLLLHLPVHAIIQRLRRRLLLGQIIRMVLICRAFQIEHAVLVYDLEKGFVVVQIHVVLDLLLKGLLSVVGDQLKLISTAHEHH